MSEIEADEREAIGADQAKDFAPLIGKTGVEFEREALRLFYDALNEQRLAGVMMGSKPIRPQESSWRRPRLSWTFATRRSARY